MSIVVKSMLCAGAALGALGGVAQARQTAVVDEIVARLTTQGGSA